MPIFVKRVTRSSHIDVAIEADNYTEASNIFDKWLQDDENSEDANCLLSEREKEESSYFYRYDNEEEFNRSKILADFVISKPEKEELKYDLYFCYNEDPNYTFYKLWEGIAMNQVIEHIQLANVDYMLKPGFPKWAKVIAEAKKRGTQILVFDLIRRNN